MTSGWWAFALVGAGLLGWAVCLEAWHETDRRLAAWWVSRARDWGGATGLCSFVTSAGALGLFGLLALVGDLVGTHLGDPRWALLVAAPAMLAYAPFVFATSPVDPTGYVMWRSALEAAGADPRQQRLIAWWAGPPSLLGMLAIMTTLWSIFVS